MNFLLLIKVSSHIHVSTSNMRVAFTEAREKLPQILENR